MARTSRASIAAAACLVVALVCGAVSASFVASAGAVHAETGMSVPDANYELGMYGDPATAAGYWRMQHSSDCGEMAVADAVGQITGREPTERQITAVAETAPSTTGPGPIWRPFGNTDIRNLPALFWHYWIRAENIQTTIKALEQDLADRRKIVVILNAETIWNRAGRRDWANHFVVVTGIDTKAGVVHLNDSGIDTGRDERVPIATFERAWAPNHNSALVTKDR